MMDGVTDSVMNETKTRKKKNKVIDFVQLNKNLDSEHRTEECAQRVKPNGCDESTLILSWKEWSGYTILLKQSFYYNVIIIVTTTINKYMNNS